MKKASPESKELIEIADTMIRDWLIGTKKSMPPTWLLIKEDGVMEAVVTPWDGQLEKDATTSLIQHIIREPKYLAYVLFTEAWFVRRGLEAGRDYKGPPPGDCPDRQECVVVTGVSRKEAKTLRLHLEIIRDKDGNCAELTRLDGPEDQIISRFDNLFNQETAH